MYAIFSKLVFFPYFLNQLYSVLRCKNLSSIDTSARSILQSSGCSWYITYNLIVHYVVPTFSIFRLLNCVDPWYHNAASSAGLHHLIYKCENRHPFSNLIILSKAFLSFWCQKSDVNDMLELLCWLHVKLLSFMENLWYYEFNSFST